jgi:predicted dehydrogenase
MVRVGIAGIGFMGVTHYKALKQVQGAQVTAIFTRNPQKLAGDWQGVKGNFGEAGGVEDLTGVKRRDTLEVLLTDPEVDLVDICLPTDMHAPAALAALAAGKHVLVEKPIALTVEDADEMIAAAERAKRLLMVGQVLRFFPEFAYIRQCMDRGEYGDLVAAHFKRVISRPNWSGENWFADASRTGGAVVDLHIHDADFVHHLLGMPEEVSAAGVTAPDGQVDYLVTQYRYKGRNRCITAASGNLGMPGLMFEHGYDAYFQRATLRYNSARGEGVEVFTEDGQKHLADVTAPDAFVAELTAAVTAVRTGEAGILSAASGRNALRLVLAEAESVRTGQPVLLG